MTRAEQDTLAAELTREDAVWSAKDQQMWRRYADPIPMGADEAIKLYGIALRTLTRR